MKICDDVMPKCLQDDLEDYFMGPYASWTFVRDSTYGNRLDALSDTQVPSFAITCLVEGSIINEAIFSISRPILLCLCNKFDIDYSSVLRMRYGMHIPTPAPEHNNPHIDFNVPHTTALYYLNDSDGDTFFFGNDGSIINRVTPKKGRAVVFNGSIKHASSVPTKDPRIVLNLNFRGIQIE